MRPCQPAWLVCACLSGCAVTLPLVSSSADRNSGVVHTRPVGATVEVVRGLTLELAKHRGLMLEDRRPGPEGTEVLVFRAENERSYRPGAPRSDSRYFVHLTPRRDGTTVRVLGLPVLDLAMSCPEVAVKYEPCEPPRLEGQWGEALPDSLWKRYRVDASGRIEAERINALLGLLTEAVDRR